MAWIELHQSLPTHRKAKQLARLLGLKTPRDTPQVVGHVCMLWLWAIDNALDGCLAGIDPEDIAEAAGWAKAPDVFLAALIGSGFVDGDMRIHDWDIYIGKLIDRRTDNARRNRESRERKKKVPCDTASASRDHHADANDTITSASRDGATVPNRTLPYLTVPNHTKPNQGVISLSDRDNPARERDFPPSLDDVRAYARRAGLTVDAERFIAVNAANGWIDGNGQPIRNWRLWLAGYKPPAVNDPTAPDPRIVALEQLRQKYLAEEVPTNDPS